MLSIFQIFTVFSVSHLHMSVLLCLFIFFLVWLKYLKSDTFKVSWAFELIWKKKEPVYKWKLKWKNSFFYFSLNLISFDVGSYRISSCHPSKKNASEQSSMTADCRTKLTLFSHFCFLSLPLIKWPFKRLASIKVNRMHVSLIRFLNLFIGRKTV